MDQTGKPEVIRSALGKRLLLKFSTFDPFEYRRIVFGTEVDQCHWAHQFHSIEPRKPPFENQKGNGCLPAIDESCS